MAVLNPPNAPNTLLVQVPLPQPVTDTGVSNPVAQLAGQSNAPSSPPKPKKKPVDPFNKVKGPPHMILPHANESSIKLKRQRSRKLKFASKKTSPDTRIVTVDKVSADPSLVQTDSYLIVSKLSRKKTSLKRLAKILFGKPPFSEKYEWFHGSPKPFDDFDFSKVGQGHDEQGPGVYFSSEEGDSEGYGSYIHRANLSQDGIVPLTGKVNKKHVDYLIKNAPDLEYSLSNWDEDPKVAYKKLKQAIVDQENPHESFKQAWYELSRNEPEQYVKNMAKLGYKVIYLPKQTKDRTIWHAVVIDPKAISKKGLRKRLLSKSSKKIKLSREATQGLLHRIADQPDSHIHHLVMADTLEDTGHSALADLYRKYALGHRSNLHTDWIDTKQNPTIGLIDHRTGGPAWYVDYLGNHGDWHLFHESDDDKASEGRHLLYFVHSDSMNTRFPQIRYQFEFKPHELYHFGSELARDEANSIDGNAGKKLTSLIHHWIDKASQEPSEPVPFDRPKPGKAEDTLSHVGKAIDTGIGKVKNFGQGIADAAKQGRLFSHVGSGIDRVVNSVWHGSKRWLNQMMGGYNSVNQIPMPVLKKVQAAISNGKKPVTKQGNRVQKKPVAPVSGKPNEINYRTADKIFGDHPVKDRFISYVNRWSGHKDKKKADIASLAQKALEGKWYTKKKQGHSVFHEIQNRLADIGHSDAKTFDLPKTHDDLYRNTKKKMSRSGKPKKFAASPRDHARFHHAIMKEHLPIKPTAKISEIIKHDLDGHFKTHTPSLVYADFLEEQGYPELANHIREAVSNGKVTFETTYENPRLIEGKSQPIVIPHTNLNSVSLSIPYKSKKKQGYINYRIDSNKKLEELREGKPDFYQLVADKDWDKIREHHDDSEKSISHLTEEANRLGKFNIKKKENMNRSNRRIKFSASPRDHERFHHAIIKEHSRGEFKSHTPSLVYADFLEEQGYPEIANHIREAVNNGRVIFFKTTWPDPRIDGGEKQNLLIPFPNKDSVDVSFPVKTKSKKGYVTYRVDGNKNLEELRKGKPSDEEILDRRDMNEMMDHWEDSKKSIAHLTEEADRIGKFDIKKKENLSRHHKAIKFQSKINLGKLIGGKSKNA